MPNNKLILRDLISPYDDTTKGTVLSHADVDNNFIYLKGKVIQTGTTLGGNLFLTSIDGSVISVPISGGSGSGLFNVTYSEVMSLINTNLLTAGSIYKITDRGDRGLFFIAVTTNKLNIDGVRLMLCPTYYDTGSFSGNTWIGVWDINKSANEDDLAIWGGMVWKNLTGAIGTSDDEVTLDGTNWELIAKSSFTNNEYAEKVFGVSYDIENDWISSQWDDNGNVFGMTYESEQDFELGYNLCDVSDWNFGTTTFFFFSNICLGVYNNISNDIMYNNIPDRIYNNNVNGAIKYNKNIGEISNNTNIGEIENNSNSGDIKNNSNDGSIQNNSNTGAIQNNSNGDDISENANLGNITNNANGGEIVKNNNLGDIDGFPSGNYEISHNTYPDSLYYLVDYGTMTEDVSSSKNKTIAGTTYVLLPWDHNNIYTNVSGCTVNVISLPVPHSSIHTASVNADITFSASGVTINNYAAHTKSNGQYSPASLFNLTTTTYILGGNTKA